MNTMRWFSPPQWPRGPLTCELFSEFLEQQSPLYDKLLISAARARRQWWIDNLKPGKFPKGAGNTRRSPHNP